MIVSLWLTAYTVLSWWEGLWKRYCAEEERQREILAESLFALMNALSDVSVQLEHGERSESPPSSRAD
ncbi:ORF05 [Psittacine aviadenovirus B]|uniref:ORF05 n=1 Tax=psittacine adenovirus 4 TaxID=2773287 RepID=A0A1P8SW70_9ADEN|nr:ORF05 [Psittacine aviadenovirus B]APY28337.1 ORF05 [psittacine adenovirus 4]